ncbi:major facilitator superfamily MFS_1 [Actinobacteria bacterium OK074]|nr:major facilitator superfamily MFS_1 [Actinobacteria bacterium OK074]
MTAAPTDSPGHIRTGRPAPDRFDRRLNAPMILGSVLNPVDSATIAVALVPIGVASGAPPARTAWLLSALYLATAVGRPVVGRLVDRYGPRRRYLLGTGLVGAAGLMGALSSSLGALIAARALLGPVATSPSAGRRHARSPTAPRASEVPHSPHRAQTRVRPVRGPAYVQYEGLRPAHREHAPDAAPSPADIHQRPPGALGSSAADAGFLSRGADTAGLHDPALFTAAGTVLLLAATLLDRSLKSARKAA